MEYLKPPLTLEQQLELLGQRGLKINDREKALMHLQHISYYRLSAYFLPFKQGELFKNSTSFEEIIHLYKFDQQLRMLVLEGIEPIEISLRTHLIYYLSHQYGAFGYLNPENFSSRFNHQKWLITLRKALEDSNEVFIQHYQKKYTSSEHLPLWMVLEIIPFGGLNRLFKGLRGTDQQKIAKHYGIEGKVLTSWLYCLVYIRNLCAHHSRLWNRILTIKPLLPKKEKEWQQMPNTRLYCVVSIIQHLLHHINRPEWKIKFITFLEENSHFSKQSMGFSFDWRNHPRWK